MKIKKDTINAIKSRMRKDNLSAALDIAQRAGVPIDEFNKLVETVGKERARKGLVNRDD